MLANLLPGLREMRTPLAAGYIWLIAGWLAFAPLVPARANATGVMADIYSLIDIIGVGAALAAISFGAYLVGVFSAGLTDALFVIGNRTLVRKLVWLTPAGPARKHRIHAIEVALLRQLCRRFDADQAFRAAIECRLQSIESEAAEAGVALPDLFAKPSAELLTDMAENPLLRARVIAAIHDLPGYASDLLWESDYIEIGAADQQILDDQSRHRAEGEFRLGVALPLAVLVLILAYRASPWWLLAGIGPLWLLYLGQASHTQGDLAVINSVSAGRIRWPSIEAVVQERPRYRDIQKIAARRD